MRAFRAMAGAVLAAAAIVLATAPPAAAHDELIGSNPTAGQHLDTAPTNVQLTFSADVLTIGAAVIVVDDSGKDWVTGEPAIRGGVVSTSLESAMPASGYEIRWRVVSSDGHPISGVIPFTVADGQPPAERPSTSTAEAPVTTTESADSSESTDASESTDTSESTNAASDTTAGAEQDGGAPRVLLVGLGGAAAALAVFLLVRFLRARNGSSGDPRP